MKKKKSLISVIAVVVILSAITTATIISRLRCDLDGVNVCYDRDEEAYRIETNAELSVQVETEELKNYLISTWNTLHPEHKDKLNVVVKNPLSLDELISGFPTDIIVTSQNNAAYFIVDSLDLGSDVANRILYYSPSSLNDASNLNGTYFIPNSVNGWLFVYNKTLAEEMDFDLKDENEDGLPDVFENWEDIFALAPKISEQIDVVFPLTFTDQTSFYPFLTGGKWRLNFTHEGSDPGFEHNEFLKGLSLIEEFSNITLDKRIEQQTAEALPWQYEEALYQRQTLFTIAIDWMRLDEYQQVTQDEYVYAPFPKYKGHYLSPIAEVDGYVVSNRVQYPSAAAEVLRILRTPQAASHYQSSTGKVFAYNRNNLNELEVDKVTKAKIRAYNHSDTLPVIALRENPKVLSRSLWTEKDFMPVLKDLFDEKITIEQAQEQFDEIATDWFLEKTKPDSDCEVVCE